MLYAHIAVFKFVEGFFHVVVVAIAEVIEDVALANAIREGEKSKPVRKDAVLKALSNRR